MEPVNQKIIDSLNEALAGELNSLYQYFIHAEMCENWGYGKLAAHIKASSIQEMHHAEKYIERILFFGGVPHIHNAFKASIGKDVPAQLASDLILETEGIVQMNKWISMCGDLGDNATRELFSQILLDEEKHADWLEQQTSLIAEIGIAQYLSQQI